MSLTAGNDAREEEEAEVAEGSMVSIEGRRRREASKGVVVVEVEHASFIIESLSLESTSTPGATSALAPPPLPPAKSLFLAMSETPADAEEEEEAA